MNRTLVRNVVRAFAVSAVVAALGMYSDARVTASGTVTISGCASPCVLKAGPDFATDTFADPWDFKNAEDVGVDPDQRSIANLTVSNDVVSGTAADSNGFFSILDLPWNGIINPGKTGRKYPIDTTKYTKLAVKMNAGDGTRFPRVYWFHNDVGQGGSGWLLFDKDVATPVGNGIYVIDLTQVNQNGLNQGTPWTSGAVEGVSFYPNDGATPFNFNFDWVRLTAGDSSSAATKMTFSWSGSSGGDVTVSDASGVPYTIAKSQPASGSLTWNYGVLPPGTYTLSVGSTMATTFTINAPPLLQITDPDETGGADFATDVLKNPWDMSDSGDINEDPCCIRDHLINESFTGVFNATSDGVTVAMAGSVPVGDPEVYLLSNPRTSNTTDIIDTTKYHRLTFDLQLGRPFNLAEGWIARVFWGSDSSDTAPGGTPYNLTTSKDIIVWPGKNTYTIDLSTLTTTNGGLETKNATPWTQNPVRHFRIDPHEIAAQVPFHIDNVKLAADDETANNSFTIRWTGSDADPGDSPTVTLYYQPAGGSPTMIASGISMAAGQYVWNTTNVPNGTYYILAQANDGVNTIVNRYSTGPVKVNAFVPVSNPQIGVDTPTANQTVTSSFEIGGWLLDAAAPSGTGVDDVKIYVQLPGAPAPGVFIGHGRLGLSRPDVAAIFGSQFSNAGFHFTITGLSPGPATLWVVGHSTVSNSDSISKSVPFTVSATGLMSVDIPTSETTITANSFGVSGWAIDRSVESTGQSGTGIDSVVVYAFHNPGSGEPAVFLGTASYGSISRPDVASFYGSRYVNSGYVFTVDRAAAGLGTGEYNIVPIAHSTVTGTYNNLAIVRVVLQ